MSDLAIVERPIAAQQRAMLDFIGARVDDHYLNLEVFCVSGPLDLDALRQALAGVVRRHEAIRSTFPKGRNVYQVRPPSADLVDDVFQVSLDLSTIDDAIAAGTAWAGAPMALDERLPLRFWVGLLDDTSSVVVIAGHYLVFDAWSFMLFYEDLTAEYDRVRRRNPQRTRPPQYSDVQDGIGSGDPDGWSELFDQPYQAIRALYHRTPTPLGPCEVLNRSWQKLGGSIALAARTHRVTPYVLGVAAMLRALSETLGDAQVVIGSPYGGRSGAESPNVIGFLATTIFVGADLKVRAGADELIRHLNGQLRQWYVKPRTQWQTVLERYGAIDLYAAKFVFLPNHFARPNLVLDGVSTERLTPPAGRSIRRPIDMTAAYGRGGVTVSLKYRPDVVDKHMGEVLLDRFTARLDELCAAR